MIKYKDGRKNEDQVFVTDYRRFAGKTGWNPIVSVHDGMRRVYDWALKNEGILRELYKNEVF